MAAPVENEQKPGFVPLQHDAWTLDEWLALQPTHAKVELVDGMLHVSPVEKSGNARLMRRITNALDDALPVGLEVMPPINVGLDARRAVIPDFSIIDVPGLDEVVVPARHLVLVGEIASPSTRVHDRTTKRALYAEAGIPFLMLVDPGTPPVAVLFELREGEYVETSRSAAGVLTFEGPFPAMLDLR